MLYAIVPLHLTEDESLALKEEVQKLLNRDSAALLPPVHVYDEHAPDLYFLTYEGTARELSNKLGYGKEDSKIGSGVVMRVSSHFGYAKKSLWEWLEVYDA